MLNDVSAMLIGLQPLFCVYHVGKRGTELGQAASIGLWPTLLKDRPDATSDADCATKWQRPHEI